MTNRLMDRKILLILIGCLVLLAAFLLHNYILSVYETQILADKEQLFADGSSQLTIVAIPINALGFKAPFKSPDATFTIEEGADLVEVVKKDEHAGILILKAKFSPGKVVVRVKPRFALFPTKLEILVSKNVA